VFDFLINAVNGLLGMSVVITLIGIVNTLSLSIIERRSDSRTAGIADPGVAIDQA
jgi:putative ABC transport system permease protein